jgi:hypothetical protein
MYLTMGVQENHVGRFTLFPYSSLVDPVSLLRALSAAEVIEGKGRGGIKIIELGGLRLVARRYLHGGLFRVFTRDLFLEQGRATSEAEIMAYLREKGFPVVAPFCAVVEKLFVVKRLHLVTILQANTVSLLEYLQEASGKQRMRAASKLAEYLWLLQRAGVYHPDLHLGNVLVTPDEDLVFLDFDRARRKTVNGGDMKSMFSRLGRFVSKMERQGLLTIDTKEKAMFLRTYARFSGSDLTAEMEGSARRTAIFRRLGWLTESLLYGRGR